MSSNGKLPWFPFYPKDYLSDEKVLVMNRAQRGSYTNLLCVAWGHAPIGTLPDDDRLLAAWAQCSAEEWKTDKEIIMNAFELHERYWHQKRMVRVAEESAELRQKKSNAGKLGNEARWHRDRSAIAVRSQNIAIHSHNHSHSHKEEKSVISGSKNGAAEDRSAAPQKNKKIDPLVCARPETKQELLDHCMGNLGLTESDGRALWDHWMGNGFRVNGKPMVSWRHTASNWCRRRMFFPSIQQERKFSP